MKIAAGIVLGIILALCVVGVWKSVEVLLNTVK
jgi:hypothetical protein